MSLLMYRSLLWVSLDVCRSLQKRLSYLNVIVYASFVGCVACCRVPKSVAVCCRVLQCFTICCSVLQRVAVSCNVMQCVARISSSSRLSLSVLQRVVVCCDVLQCVAGI